jgi:hypothetical protein
VIARYPAKCFVCGKSITVGIDEYDYDLKRSVHLACKAEDNPQPTAEQLALAEKLGFKPHEELRSDDGNPHAIAKPPKPAKPISL